MPLETARLRLRPFTVADAPFILGLLNEPSWIQNIGDRGIRTLDAARAYIENGPVVSHARNGFALDAVELKESGTLIGMCGLIRRDTLPDVDVGFALLPAFWSQGYALEAATAVMKDARERLGIQRVLAIVDPRNAPSKRLLEKLGFALEGRVKLSADDIDLDLYAST